MDIKEFAKSISGKEYGYLQFIREEIETENGFVIVYGASDDLMEFEGAIQDEIGCYEGGIAKCENGAVCDCSIYDYEHNPQNKIKAIWCGGEQDEKEQEITWTYETEIPHETFMIYEDEEPYCRGIVFHISDLED